MLMTAMILSIDFYCFRPGDWQVAELGENYFDHVHNFDICEL